MLSEVIFKMLKESSFNSRAILDSSIKWAITQMIQRVSKGTPEAKGRKWNKSLCQLGWQNAYSSIARLNPSPGYMPVLKKCVDTFFVMADEEKERELKGFSKWAVEFGIGFFHRGIVHLIWKRADVGCWNRILSERSWELAHELINELPNNENKRYIKQAIDSAFLITDADDPYYTAYKWWLFSMQNIDVSQEKEEENIIYKLYVEFLQRVKDKNLLNGLKEDFSPDINKASAENMTKKDMIIGGPVEEKRKLARLNCPL